MELFDYAPYMIKIQQSEKAAHDLLLEKRYEEVLPHLSEIMVAARMTRAWVIDKIEEQQGHSFMEKED